MTVTQSTVFLEKGDRRIIRGWVIYDWANSVYQLTIASAIFPVYYNSVTRSEGTDIVDFFGFPIINTVLYSWGIAAAYLLIAIFSPLLASIADYSGRRKLFMSVFTWLGALSCGLLFFFDKNHIELGIIAFFLAWVGYCGSLVFYNSFLPVIAEPKDQDRISAQGYSMGYLGGVVLLIINLIVLLKPGWFGISDPSMPARIAFLTVFIWWIGFAQVTFSRLPKYTLGKRGGGHLLLKGYSEIRSVLKLVRTSRVMTLYLLAFFFLTSGVLTVMFMAATYGEKELQLGDALLIGTILCIQLLGMLGAWLFARFSKRIGNLNTLIMLTLTWIIICIVAYYITNAAGFIIVATFVGFVMGGTQALARSTYSKMIPETRDHTSFFSFYDVMEKLATVAGTFSFGILEALTGNMRMSVLGVVGFFAVAFVFLILTKKEEKGSNLVI